MLKAADPMDVSHFPDRGEESPTYSLGKRNLAVANDEEKELRINKLELSIEIMQREKYIKDLEILKLERDLLIPES